MAICKICNKSFINRYKDKVNICASCREEILNSLPDIISEEDFVNYNVIDESPFHKLIDIHSLQYYYVKCIYKNCNYYKIIIRDRNNILDKIKNNEPYICFCSKNHQLAQARKNSMSEGPCVSCGKIVSKRDVAKYGINCGCSRNHAKQLNENNSKAGRCVKCGAWNEFRTTAGLGIECGYSKNLAIKIRPILSGKGKCTNCGKSSENRSGVGYCSDCQAKVSKNVIFPKFCIKCNQITEHNGSICLVCHPESSPSSSKEFRKFTYNIECNKKCHNLNDCKNKYNKNILKNAIGYCEEYINSWGSFEECNKYMRIFDQLNIECNNNCSKYKNVKTKMILIYLRINLDIV